MGEHKSGDVVVDTNRGKLWICRAMRALGGATEVTGKYSPGSLPDLLRALHGAAEELGVEVPLDKDTADVLVGFNRAVDRLSGKLAEYHRLDAIREELAGVEWEFCAYGGNPPVPGAGEHSCSYLNNKMTGDRVEITCWKTTRGRFGASARVRGHRHAHAYYSQDHADLNAARAAAVEHGARLAWAGETGKPISS